MCGHIPKGSVFSVTVVGLAASARFQISYVLSGKWGLQPAPGHLLGFLGQGSGARRLPVWSFAALGSGDWQVSNLQSEVP